MKDSRIWKIMWNEIIHDKLALIGLILFVVIVATVYIWAIFIDADVAMRINLRTRNLPPSWDHILGTDPAGRDMLTRLILSARVSFNIAFLVTFGGVFIGMIVGMFAGFYGGHVDNAIMRVMDFIAMVPMLIMIIVFVSLVPNYTPTVFAMIFIAFSWQGTARLIRSMALQQSNLDYVSASKTLGTYNVVIIFREVLPNLVSISVSNFTLALAANMGIETGLTFLGFGLPFGTQSLGRLLAYARSPDYMVLRPWLWLPAALLIIIMMLCINFVGQALNRAADAKKRLA